ATASPRRNWFVSALKALRRPTSDPYPSSSSSPAPEGAVALRSGRLNVSGAKLSSYSLSPSNGARSAGRRLLGGLLVRSGASATGAALGGTWAGLAEPK